MFHLLKEENGVYRLEDTALVAFLQLCGFTVIPWISREATPEEPTARISFDVSGGDIEEAVKAYYANQQVGIQDFVKNLKSVRGAMFNLKQLNKEKMNERI